MYFIKEKRDFGSSITIKKKYFHFLNIILINLKVFSVK